MHWCLVIQSASCSHACDPWLRIWIFSKASLVHFPSGHPHIQNLHACSNPVVSTGPAPSPSRCPARADAPSTRYLAAQSPRPCLPAARTHAPCPPSAATPLAATLTAATLGRARRASLHAAAPFPVATFAPCPPATTASHPQWRIGSSQSRQRTWRRQRQAAAAASGAARRHLRHRLRRRRRRLRRQRRPWQGAC